MIINYSTHSNMNKYLYSLLLLIATLTVGCGGDTLQGDIDDIRERLTEEGLISDAQETPEGVFIVTHTPGNGVDFPSPTQTVNIRYTGRLFEEGTIFDMTTGTDPSQLNLQNVIEGWRIGIPLLSKGEKADLYIPSSLAYGQFDRAGIPGGSILVFEVELISFF